MIARSCIMKKHVLVLGCMIFGESQGSKGGTEVQTIEKVEVFNTEGDLNNYIEELERDGLFDSYVVLNDTTPMDSFREEYEGIMTKFLSYKTDAPIDDLVYIIEHKETNI